MCDWNFFLHNCVAGMKPAIVSSWTWTPTQRSFEGTMSWKVYLKQSVIACLWVDSLAGETALLLEVLWKVLFLPIKVESLANMTSSSVDEMPPLATLREDVLCTVCLSLPKVAMYQCKNGYLICKDCLEECGDTCPTCKEPLEQIRSIITDKVHTTVYLMIYLVIFPSSLIPFHLQILSLMPSSCKHADMGCQEEFYHRRLKAHEAACPFRPVCCMDILCEAKVAFCKVLDHMFKKHKNVVHVNKGKYRVRKTGSDV